MNTKLQELTKKIYTEGVEKANSEAELIIDKANKEANTIIENARKQAVEILDNARKESEQLNNKVLSELKMSGNQAISLLKQEVTNLLSSSALSTEIKKSTGDVDFIKNLIKEIVTKWDPASKGLDLNIILPEKLQKDLTDYFKSQASGILNAGIELKFEDRMPDGFKIGPKDNSFVLSFTEDDFKSFFQSFLKPKTKEILFS